MSGNFKENNRLKWWEKLIITMIVILVLIIIFLIFNEKIIEAVQGFKSWYNKG
ncbi:hypothetical protein LLG07_03670 [bacterium]|nr:hypothetical protein [bacterium]